ncbi:uncharacterized protein LOC142920140 [Petromyzon marinus]|uniref:uncharacterized protein LOC142920140 n=1 Tax=Petromyzon marinus TaxID=7757 RepID=UPI003F6FA055
MVAASELNGSRREEKGTVVVYQLHQRQQERAGHAMLPLCLAVLLLASVAVRDVTFAAKLRLSLQERLDVTEGVSLTINCSFSPPPTDPNHVIVKWSVLPAFYSKNTPIGGVIQIYNSGVDVVGVAALVGDVAKGDCSVRLRRVSAGLGPVIGCMVVCGRCNTEDVAVAREATLNVTVAGERSERRFGGTVRSRRAAWQKMGGWVWVGFILDLKGTPKTSTVTPPNPGQLKSKGASS